MSRLRRPDVDPYVVLTQLDSRLRRAELEELGEGWDNVAYAVTRGGRALDLVLRISKISDPAERAATVSRDAALLDFVAAHASLATNTVIALDTASGALLLSLVPGEIAEHTPPRDTDAAAAAVGCFLTGIHRATPPPGLVAPDRSAERWHAETAADFTVAAERIPSVDRAAIEAFLAEPVPDRPERLVFCHNDLGDEHLIVDPVSREVTGVIDWSDAVFDDPARDFALLLFDFGGPFFRSALAAYGGPVDPGFASRARWFAARAGVAGVTHRALAGDPGLALTLQRLRPLLVRP